VTDLIFIVTLVAFFALMVALVRMCERIIGKEEAVGSDHDNDDAPTESDRTDTTTPDTTTPEEVPA